MCRCGVNLSSPVRAVRWRHLHPQTELVEGDKWAGEHLHAFGNLCLVSHAMNSRLSNSGPEDKFKQLMSEKKSQSLKVFAMHSEFVKQRQWAAEVAISTKRKCLR